MWWLEERRWLLSSWVLTCFAFMCGAEVEALTHLCYLQTTRILSVEVPRVCHPSSRQAYAALLLSYRFIHQWMSIWGCRKCLNHWRQTHTRGTVFVLGSDSLIMHVHRCLSVTTLFMLCHWHAMYSCVLVVSDKLICTRVSTCGFVLLVQGIIDFIRMFQRCAIWFC